MRGDGQGCEMDAGSRRRRADPLRSIVAQGHGRPLPPIQKRKRNEEESPAAHTGDFPVRPQVQQTTFLPGVRPVCICRISNNRSAFSPSDAFRSQARSVSPSKHAPPAEKPHHRKQRKKQRSADAQTTGERGFGCCPNLRRARAAAQASGSSQDVRRLAGCRTSGREDAMAVQGEHPQAG